MSIKSDPRQWKDPRHRRGFEGEMVAMAYLMGGGWTVLSHRFRLGRLEIDVVARRRSVVAFVEVKTRFGRAFGRAIEAVGPRKQREIVRVATAWIDRYGRPGDEYRLDAIGVEIGAKGIPEIEHVAGAFRAGWR